MRQRKTLEVKGAKFGPNLWRLSFAFCLACSAEAYAFKIVEPADSSTLASGQTIPAKVELGSDTGIVKVRYFWYPESADTLVEQDEEKLSKSAKEMLADEKFVQRDSVTGVPVVALPALASTAEPTWVMVCSVVLPFGSAK